MSPFDIRMGHTQSLKRQVQMEKDCNGSDQAMIMYPGVDDVAGANVCVQDVSELRECCIDDLIQHHKDKIAVGKILWVRNILPCFKISSLQCCVSDDQGVVITLSLYNFISFDSSQADCQKWLPVNSSKFIPTKEFIRNYRAI